MGHVLAAILDKPSYEVSHTLSKLEEKHGYPSHDVRLLVSNIQKLRAKTTKLGLDPDDTTAEELYHALLSRYDADCGEFMDSLNLKNGSNLSEKLNKTIQAVSALYPDQDLWGLKLTAAKQIILANPPKKTMKNLHYRSAESLVKREDIREVIALSLLLESKTWLSAWAKAVAKQPTVNFERRAPKIIKVSSKNQKKLGSKQDKLFYPDTVMGSVFLVPSEEFAKMPLLTIALALRESLEDLGIKAPVDRLNGPLDFWSDTDQLLGWKDTKAVSLNVYDVAHNHLHNLSFDSRVKDKGAKSLWDQLLNLYGKETEGLEEAVQNTTYKLKQVASLPESMAVEYEYIGA